MFKVTAKRTGHLADTISQDVRTTGEALSLYMNEIRDLLDQGFVFPALPEGVFPVTSTYAVKGRTTVHLSVEAIADR